jgi:hypothetical protein
MLMTSRRGFAAALLLAAAPAAAQLEVRLAPTAGLPAMVPAAVLSAPALAALPPAPSLLAAPRLGPAAFAAAPAAAQASPAATPAALSAALGEFDKVDLAKAAPDRASAAGEALMRRALAGGADAASESVADVLAASPAPRLARPDAPSGPRVYLLSRPLRERVALGPIALAGHALFSAAWEAGKAWVGWKAGGWAGAGAVTVVELPFAPFMAGGRTFAHLGLRYWRRKLAVLREIAREPGVERVRVLTSGETKFWGPLVRSRDNTGLIFVDSSRELPAEFGRFGAPVPLGDLSARVRISFVQAEARAAVVWTPTLGELLDERPVPTEIAAAWRAAVKANKSGHNPAARALDAAIDAARDVAHVRAPKLGGALEVALEVARGGAPRLEAVILGPAGEHPIDGAIAEGPALLKLIGLGRLDRVRAFFRRPLPARSIAITDAAVERPGAARGSGFGAWLARAWRGLRGRLIVAR